MKHIPSYLRSRKALFGFIALGLFLLIQVIFFSTFRAQEDMPVKKQVIAKTLPPEFVKNVVIADQEMLQLTPEFEVAPKTIQLGALPEISDGQESRIIIIIDDVGMNLKYSQEAIDFDVPITLAFLPYAPKVKEFAAAALTNGHEAIIHMPMEPMDSSVNAGKKALKTSMSAETIEETMESELEGLEGFSGMNNHMGSKFTQDRKSLETVMAYLKEKGLFFIDSRTIGNSLAGTVAKEHGVPTLDRDIFLDHEESPEFVSNALLKLEKKAKEDGVAVAIGHPKKVTLDALKQWAPDAQKRGFKIVKAGDYLSSVKAEQHAGLE